MRSWFWVVLLLFVPGCTAQPERGEVSGTITLVSGKPLPTGTIRFLPTDGSRPTFARIQDGRYHLDADKGPRLGTHKVHITSDRPTGRKVEPGDGPRDALVDEIDQFLPAEYNIDSQIMIEIQAGANTFDLKLEVD